MLQGNHFVFVLVRDKTKSEIKAPSGPIKRRAVVAAQRRTRGIP